MGASTTSTSSHPPWWASSNDIPPIVSRTVHTSTFNTGLAAARREGGWPGKGRATLDGEMIEPSTTPADVRRGAGAVDEAALADVMAAIQPLIRHDGGDAELVGVAGSTVRLRLVGACAGCPSATATMRTGIERILKDRVEGVRAVVDAG